MIELRNDEDNLLRICINLFLFKAHVTNGWLSKDIDLFL